jgi:hypothetical protein
MRNSLGIHYDNLGSYKELLDLSEAKNVVFIKMRQFHSLIF